MQIHNVHCIINHISIHKVKSKTVLNFTDFVNGKKNTRERQISLFLNSIISKNIKRKYE